MILSELFEKVVPSIGKKWDSHLGCMRWKGSSFAAPKDRGLRRELATPAAWNAKRIR
jgi:hypothetical protein